MSTLHTIQIDSTIYDGALASRTKQPIVALLQKQSDIAEPCQPFNHSVPPKELPTVDVITSFAGIAG